ncbi:MAG: META domain-containing protein [Acidimicrobiia bacterium]
MRFPAGRWMVESMAIGGELQPTLDGPVLTLEVTSEGEVSGSAGINRFRGRLSSDRLFGPLTTTRMFGPHELMAQEHIYIRHLGAAEGYEIDADTGGINLVANGLIVVTLRGLVADPSG